MNDSERRGILLQHYYEVRRKAHGREPSPDQLKGQWNEDEIRRVALLLYQAGLVKGTEVSDADGKLILEPEITHAGIDVIEGNAEPPTSVNQTYHNYNISDSIGVQAGPNNVQHVNVQQVSDAIIQLANGIAATEDEEQKEEAAGRLKALVRHPVFYTLLGAGAETLIAEVMQILG